MTFKVCPNQIYNLYSLDRGCNILKEIFKGFLIPWSNKFNNEERNGKYEKWSLISWIKNNLFQYQVIFLKYQQLKDTVEVAQLQVWILQRKCPSTHTHTST